MSAYFDKNRKIILVGLAFLFSLFLLFAISEDLEKNINQEKALIKEAFVCSEPGADGNPGKKTEVFYGGVIDDIYLCLQIVPSGYTSIYTNWKEGIEEYTFLISPKVEVEDSGWIIFSLGDILRSNEAEILLDSETIKSGILPIGNYTVVIRQQRTSLVEMYFKIK